MKIQIPEDVNRIIHTLEDAGFEAYAVGGCVRDSLIGRTPQDWDITTNASPEQVKACFKRTVDTGIQHGTVTVMLNRSGYEVTTYRIDGAYNDSRHPDSVTFTSSLAEDLKRRDFTINAMAYNDEDGLVDLFSGQEDLKDRVIRAVGDPAERFTEDALRILRCIRFSAQLDFSIEAETYAAARKLSGRLSAVSKERIREELMKTLASAHPEKAAVFDDIGAMFCICPDFADHREKSVTKLKGTEADRVLRLCAFLEGHDKASAETILRDLKFDNDTVKRVTRLISFLGRDLSDDEAALRHLIHDYGEADLELLLIYRERTDLCGPVQKILERGDCVSLKTLAVTGKDLTACGVKPGKEMGQILERLLEAVLEDPEKNSRETLLNFL